jgi:CO/xanthine dehydrogenase Mo-binding subunit
LIGIAPAIGNAIYKLTGERRRGLPLARRQGQASSKA